MITPDGADREHRSARPRRAVLLGIAALVVIGGLIAVGALRSPDLVAVEETTSTVGEVEPPVDPENFTVGQIATGEPLEWELSMAIDDHSPLDLFEHEEDFYLFTGSEPVGSPESAGLMAWRSSNGTNWEALGEVISAAHRITTVDSTVQGLVATAIRREDGALMLWESADAIEWTGSEVPTGTQGPYHIDVASAVGANDTTLLVAGNGRYDRERLLEDRLMALGTELDLSELTWSLRWLGEQGQHLFVTGPFGVPLLQQPVDTLGLSEEERQELTTELLDPVGTDVWLRNPGSGWETGLIGDTRVIDSIISTPDDRLIAYGTGTAGRLAKATRDGIDWSPTASTISPLHIVEWKQRYVGAVGTPDLMVSEDGESWRAAGLHETFPNELSWAPGALGAGEGGVAVYVRGDRAPSRVQAETLEVTDEEGSAYLVVQQGEDFVLSSDGGRDRWVLNEGGELIEVDVARRRVTLNDPETGRDRASFSIAELLAANRQYDRDLISAAGFWGVMAFTADGDQWVIQDMAPEIGDHTTVSLLEVTGDRVVAVVGHASDPLIRGEVPGLEIWSAPIP